jgi:hypothetical protein
LSESADEKLLQQLEEELKKVKVSDLLVQTLFTVSSLGYSRLGKENRDLEQAKLAIEAMKALVPVLGDAVPEEVVRDLNQVTANMQLAYASAVAEEKRPSEDDAPAGEP